MKKIYVFLLLFVAIINYASAADRYWVGASGGGWGTVSNWATTSGGAGGAGVPAANDNVFIELASDIKIDMSSMTSFSSPAGFNRVSISKTGAATIYTLDLNYNSTTAKNFITNAGAGGGFSIGAGCRLISTGTTFNADGSYSNGRLVFTIQNGTNVFDGGIHFMGAASQIVNTTGTTISVNDTLAIYGGTGGAANFSLSAGTVNYGANAVVYVGRNGSSLSSSLSSTWNSNATLYLGGNRKPDKTPITTASFSMPSTGIPITQPINYTFDIPGVSNNLTAFGSTVSSVIMTNLKVISFGTAELRICSSTAAATTVITVNQNFTISAGAKAACFNTGSGTPVFLVKGNVINNGTLNVNIGFGTGTSLNFEKDFTNAAVGSSLSTLNGAATIRSNGTTAQILTIPNTTGTLLNFNFQNADNIQVNSTIGDVAAIRNVSAINGKLKLGAYNIIINGANGITGSSSNYIVTDGTGKITLKNIPTTGKAIHMGISTTSYDPIAITPDAVADFTVNVKSADPTFSNIEVDATKTCDREWDVTTLSTGAFLEFEPDAASNCPAPGTKVIGHYSGSTWTESLNLPTGNFGYTYNSKFFSFSPFGVGNALGFASTTLNSSLSNFKVAKNLNQAAINWSIPLASNVASFEILESVDGVNFRNLSTVIASSGITNFSATDDNLNTGANYYKLKIISRNGTISYSQTAVIYSDDKGFMVNMLPTLVKNSATLQLSAAKAGKVNVDVMDIVGHRIKTHTFNVQAGSQNQNLELSSLANGNYQLVISHSDGNKQTIRFIKE